MDLVENRELDHRYWNEYAGKFIKEKRTERGLERIKLSKLTGINKDTIRNLENNIRSPVFSNLILIFQVLDLSIEDFSNYLKKQNQ